jgi:DNA-binding transcriptional LysR family regulator
MDLTDGLFASPSYLAQVDEPMHPRELRQLRFVGAEEPETITLCRRHAIGDFLTAQRIRLATHDETKAAVMANRGIAALPFALVADELDACQLVRVLPDWSVIDPETMVKELAAFPESLRMFSL